MAAPSLSQPPTTDWKSMATILSQIRELDAKAFFSFHLRANIWPEVNFSMFIFAGYRVFNKIKPPDFILSYICIQTDFPFCENNKTRSEDLK